MEIPYTKEELEAAFDELCRRTDLNPVLLESELGVVAQEFTESFPIDKKELYKKIAEFAETSVEDLRSRRDYYNYMSEEYYQTKVADILKRMAERTGMTEIQAWSCFAKAKGVI